MSKGMRTIIDALSTSTRDMLGAMREYNQSIEQMRTMLAFVAEPKPPLTDTERLDKLERVLRIDGANGAAIAPYALLSVPRGNIPFTHGCCDTLRQAIDAYKEDA